MANIKHNPLIVERLREKYGVSKRFITMSIDGDRKSETSDSIKKDYRSMKRKIDGFLKTTESKVTEMLKAM